MLFIGARAFIRSPGIKGPDFHAVDILPVSMKLIKALLISDKEVNQHTERNTDAEAEGIDKRIQLPLEDIAGSDLNVVVDHGTGSLVRNNTITTTNPVGMV
jgi:hypothetical protein